MKYREQGYWTAEVNEVINIATKRVHSIAMGDKYRTMGMNESRYCLDELKELQKAHEGSSIISIRTKTTKKSFGKQLRWELWV